MSTAVAYHVDPDAGSDSQDGLSPQTAWKTWERFPKIAQPGVSLLLKRGAVFALPLPLVGGLLGAPVTYGAYGKGPKPILEGNLRDFSRPEAWTAEGAGLWRTKDSLADVANVIFEDSTCGNMRYAKEDLMQQGEWFQPGNGSGPVFLFSSANPAQTWRKVEIILAVNGITAKGQAHSHIHFHDLAIRKVGRHGIHIVDGATHVTVNRCDLSLIGGAVFRVDEFSASYGRRFLARRVRFGNAIETWSDVSDVTIAGCRVSEVFDGGFCIQGFAGAVANNVVLRNCVFWNCGYDSIDIAHGVWARNAVFEYNTCVHAGEGWALQGEPWPRYSLHLPDNVGYHCNLESSFGWDQRSEVIVCKNIFYHAPRSRCFTCGSKVPSKLIVVDDNCYCQPNAVDALVQIGATPFTAATFAEYQRLTGWDRHSIIADPLFVDAAAGDFRLQAGSPCPSIGAQAGLRPE